MDIDLDIDRMFGDRLPTVDTSGALRQVFDAFAQRRPVCALLIDADRLHVYPKVQDSTAHWLNQLQAAMRDAVGRDGRPRWTRIDDRWLLLCRPDPSRVRAAIVGLLTKFDHEPSLPDDLSARLAAIAPFVALTVALARDGEVERLRNLQLLAGQETVRLAQEQTVADVLEEREERLREKRHHINMLEGEVHRRSTALREALSRAEQASQAKNVFLANMSHEIRTPMTAILGYAETLMDAQLSGEQRDAAVSTILRNGRHLLALINDILDISKIEAGKLTTERINCDVINLTADVEALLRPRAADMGLAFDVRFGGPMPRTVKTDPTRLRQILINLVGNAIKFTESGTVTLEVGMDTGKDSGSNELMFRVSDTGVGLTPAQRDRLFQPFSQADCSMTRRFGGTGLGLSISKSLAQKLGGDLTVESTYGVGSVFCVRIDVGDLDGVEVVRSPSLADATRAREPAPVEADREPERHLEVRVLLAEDGPDNQRLISFLLRKAGAVVHVVENGRLAVDAALAAVDAGQPFDVILMDMQMPVMDGYAATAQLRAADYHHPIIALTAHAMSGDRERCLESGCDEYEPKPIDRRTLVAKVWDLARRRQAAPA
jgi:signal transduction histidine kinase/CheY-like chemotaxis protein